MTKQNENPRQLKNVLINPRFQLRLMSYFLGLFLLSTTCLYSTTYLFFWRLKDKGHQVGIPDGHIFYQFLENQKSELDFLFLGLAIANFILLLTVGFFISHRIAGPLVKIKNFLTSEEPEDFRLRENDFLKDMEPILNNLKKK